MPNKMIEFLEKGGIRGALGLPPETELKASTIVPGSAVPQSAFRLMVSPLIDYLGGIAGDQLKGYIEKDEDFQKFQKRDPELANKMLTVAAATPTAIGGFLTAIRGLNREASGIRANKPGQISKLFKSIKNSEENPMDLIDILIKRRYPQPKEIGSALSKEGPKNIDSALETFLRR